MKRKMILGMVLVLGAFTVSGCGVKITMPSISFENEDAEDDVIDTEDDYDEDDFDDDYYEEDIDEELEDETDSDSVQIKASPDKYTWYMQSYVGRNLASCGYTSLGGDRMDTYGAGHVELNIIADDGSFIDIDDEEQLKEYVVAEQSIEPNTEIKLEFECDSEGEEYDNLIRWQSIDQIDLLVKKVGSELSSSAPTLVATKAADDRYTFYIHNYVGRNLAMTGYTSLGGSRMDSYSNCYIELVLVTDDGSYVDIEDDEQMKNYIITSQDIAPNTQFTCTYELDSDGNEYSNLIATQTIEKVTLHLSKL